MGRCQVVDRVGAAEHARDDVVSDERVAVARAVAAEVAVGGGFDHGLRLAAVGARASRQGVLRAAPGAGQDDAAANAAGAHDRHADPDKQGTRRRTDRAVASRRVPWEWLNGTNRACGFVPSQHPR